MEPAPTETACIAMTVPTGVALAPMVAEEPTFQKSDIRFGVLARVHNHYVCGLDHGQTGTNNLTIHTASALLCASRLSVLVTWRDERDEYECCHPVCTDHPVGHATGIEVGSSHVDIPMLLCRHYSRRWTYVLER